MKFWIRMTRGSECDDIFKTCMNDVRSPDWKRWISDVRVNCTCNALEWCYVTLKPLISFNSNCTSFLSVSTWQLSFRFQFHFPFSPTLSWFFFSLHLDSIHYALFLSRAFHLALNFSHISIWLKKNQSFFFSFSHPFLFLVAFTE